MSTDVIVLNGGSSSGKSSIARALQVQLPRPWLVFGVDTLGDALPQSGDQAVVTFGSEGQVHVAPGYRPVEKAWRLGLGAIASAGVGIILDEIFLLGGKNQDDLAAALTGLAVVWVGVRCDPAVAAVREAARPERVVGMAVSQAEIVHQDVVYDFEVDTTLTSAAESAQSILDHFPALTAPRL